MNGQPATTGMSLDLMTMRYTTLAPMITARYSHATAVLDGKLFVMGGYNRSRLLVVLCPAWSAWTWRQGRGRRWRP